MSTFVAHALFLTFYEKIRAKGLTGEVSCAKLAANKGTGWSDLEIAAMMWTLFANVNIVISIIFLVLVVLVGINASLRFTANKRPVPVRAD